VSAPIAIVTGAGRGLGRAIADRLRADGFETIGIDVDGVAGTVVCDVTDHAAVEALIASLPCAPVAVVNNAGIVRFGSLLDVSDTEFRRVVDVNLTGTFTVARVAARRMVADGTPGSIVNITSINGVSPGLNSGAYGSTKAAVALLTRQMALEWGTHGIRVNAVAPGLIDAGMSEPIYADPDARAARSGRVPLGRLGTSDDIASAVSFLLSGEAAYITGTEMVVDGGVVQSAISSLPRPKTVDGVGLPNPAATASTINGRDRA
jgi:NAD(P)-dependent dehydrogenase (short-subunit alcohol dehydrogenase family)